MTTCVGEELSEVHQQVAHLMTGRQRQHLAADLPDLRRRRRSHDAAVVEQVPRCRRMAEPTQQSAAPTIDAHARVGRQLQEPAGRQDGRQPRQALCRPPRGRFTSELPAAKHASHMGCSGDSPHEVHQEFRLRSAQRASFDLQMCAPARPEESSNNLGPKLVVRPKSWASPPGGKTG